MLYHFPLFGKYIPLILKILIVVGVMSELISDFLNGKELVFAFRRCKIITLCFVFLHVGYDNY